MDALSSCQPTAIGRAIQGHAIADALETQRVRSLSEHQRAAMLEAACFAAAEIERSRLVAGMAPSEPAPWPASTREFLRKHALNARG